MPRTQSRREVIPRQRCCTGDEGRPFGASLQGKAPNHLKLHRSRAVVVSVEEKAGLDPVRWEPGRRTRVNR